MMGTVAQILQLPREATKLGFKRAKKCRKRADDLNQLALFDKEAPESAAILEFRSGLSPFEQALLSDERGDQRAAELYALAIEQQDCPADAFCNLGIIESENGNRTKAFDCFTTCLTKNPRHIEAHYNLANLYFEQDDFRLAQFHFEIAVELDPDFANAHFNLALVRAINGDTASALQTLSRYKQLVAPSEARIADEVFNNLKTSVTVANQHRTRSA